MYKLNFLVPEAHLESVKTACFEAGGGKIGSYEKCAWQILGTGQYLPTSISNPYQGMRGKLEVTQEYLVDMVVDDHCIKTVVEALLRAHPYETPAYGIWKIATVEDL